MSDDHLPAGIAEVLESAARLQQLVPNAVLVGGSAAVWYARHRSSFDHDHVVSDLRQRFHLVLDALEQEGDRVTNRAAEGKIVLRELGGIETGVRQLRRAHPLEVQQIKLPSGNLVTVPTIEETLRVKAFLLIARNRVRDFLDVVALSDTMGITAAAATLRRIDVYYQDTRRGDDAVVSQLARQLADPDPADSRVLRQLANYKNLAPRWQNWANVVDQCHKIALAMTIGAQK
ncbi:nucleotidyl transferase AbiEii/AbiGii toxin family protein [Microlunatus speluncae]|uniref:nucleotidyl transferase AbiEii/AbiGii toxin family protein n=1 Tax=Microlunatus speluncae TaxID=2594267 RepID=UPI001C2D4394|nr:nucleotidyl transferase AbiEii/AbiGii toxin family protein [Microlunatus speluncae]